jgi:SAM-dependent methyltransferase
VSGAPPVTAEAVAAMARRSPVEDRLRLSEHADRDELRFRDELESFPDPVRDIPAWIRRKELREKLEWDLDAAGVEPAGTVVELGAGSCWLAAVLARRERVERVVAVEFSRRRLLELAPVAMAYVGAPAEKIERVLADFYEPGLPEAAADLVVMDAAFHHAADPVALARIAFSLLRPGGSFVLHREPTLALLRRTRDHGVEAHHGDFEHEYDRWVYLRFLRQAGFDARSHLASVGGSRRRARLYVRRPFRWLNGVAFANYTYVAVKPPSAAA